MNTGSGATAMYEKDTEGYVHELETALIDSISSTLKTTKDNSNQLNQSKREHQTLEGGYKEKVKNLERELANTRKETMEAQKKLKGVEGQLATQSGKFKGLEDECAELEKQIVAIKHSFLPRSLSKKAEQVITSPRAKGPSVYSSQDTFPFEFENNVWFNHSFYNSTHRETFQT